MSRRRTDASRIERPRLDNKWARLTDRERSYAAKRDAGPELYDALEEAVCLIPISQQAALAKFKALLAKARGETA